MSYTLSQHASDTMQERSILAEWIERAILTPDLVEADRFDPTIEHVLCKISEHGDRVLRVVYNRTKQPPHIITVFFDRGMKGKL